MVRWRRIGEAVIVLAVLGLVAGSAQAISISVPNYSFEIPDVDGNNKAFPGGSNITSWSSSTNCSTSAHIGCWDSAIPGVTGGQHAMVYIAGTDNGKWIKLTSGVLAQSVSGETYTASADFASAATSWQPALVELQLWVGGSKVASVAGTQTDTFTTASVDYASGTAGADVYVQVLFTGAGGTSNPNKAAVDNVQLSVTPEPAAMSLLAVGGLGLLMRRRRR